MPFPFLTVLAAAPGILSGAADLVRLIRPAKERGKAAGDLEKQVSELREIVAQQSVLIQELAESNQNMALAMRNGRILSVVALLAGLAGIVAGIVY